MTPQEGVGAIQNNICDGLSGEAAKACAEIEQASRTWPLPATRYELVAPYLKPNAEGFPGLSRLLERDCRRFSERLRLQILENAGGNEDAVRANLLECARESEGEVLSRRELAGLKAQLGGKLFDNGDYANSAGAFGQAYQLRPDSKNLYNMAMAFYRANEVDEALAGFNRYLKEYPASNDRDEVAKFVAELTRRQEPHKTAIAHFEGDRFPQALAAFEQADEIFKSANEGASHPEYTIYRGLCYANMGQYNKGIALLEEGLNDLPPGAPMRLQVLPVLEQMKKAQARQEISGEPASSDNQVYLGWKPHELWQMPAVFEDGHTRIKAPEERVSPEVDTAKADWYNRKGLDDLASGRLDDAVDSFNKAYFLNPLPGILQNLNRAKLLLVEPQALSQVSLRRSTVFSAETRTELDLSLQNIDPGKIGRLSLQRVDGSDDPSEAGLVKPANVSWPPSYAGQKALTLDVPYSLKPGVSYRLKVAYRDASSASQTFSLDFDPAGFGEVIPVSRAIVESADVKAGFKVMVASSEEVHITDAFFVPGNAVEIPSLKGGYEFPESGMVKADIYFTNSRADYQRSGLPIRQGDNKLDLVIDGDEWKRKIGGYLSPVLVMVYQSKADPSKRFVRYQRVDTN